MTTYDKKANKLSIQNNGIHQRRGRHTCLAPRTMPHCLFIRCQKSLCLLGDSDSNLILFIFIFFLGGAGEGGDLELWGEERKDEGEVEEGRMAGVGGERSLTHIFFPPFPPIAAAQ